MKDTYKLPSVSSGDYSASPFCVTGNMFNSWRTSVIMISVFVVLGVIAGILIAVFAHKNKGKMLVFLLF